MRKMLFIRRYFEFGVGWGEWRILGEVEIIAETANAYKIRYPGRWGRLVERWEFKGTLGDRIFEEIKEVKKWRS